MTCKNCGNAKSVKCICDSTLYNAKGLKCAMTKGGIVRCPACGREYSIKSVIYCLQNHKQLTNDLVTRQI